MAIFSAFPGQTNALSGCSDTFNRPDTALGTLGRPSNCSGENYKLSGLGTDPAQASMWVYNNAYATPAGTVSYASLPVSSGKKIGHMEEYFLFIDGDVSSGNAVVMLAGKNYPYNNYNSISVGLHFVIKRDSWYASVIPSGASSEIVLAGGFYNSVLPSGEYRAAADIKKGSATLSLPDGSVKTVNDPRIDTYNGRWATSEIVNYYQTGSLYAVDSWSFSQQ